MNHGTPNAYANGRCRCRPCTDAMTAYRRHRLARVQRITDCPNCGGLGGLYANGTCGTCYEYRRRTGRPRPRGGFPRHPRHCVTCEVRMPAGKPLRNDECEACARYRWRTGRERPERLRRR